MSGIQPPPSETDLLGTPIPSIFPKLTPPSQPLHRISDVRRAQNLSIATLARRLELEVDTVREAEQPASDMLLSILYKWSEAIDVPAAELLVEPDALPANPLRNRGKLLRIMKTARTICENTHEKSIATIAQTLIDQLIDLMPELETVTSWPTIGQSRHHKEYGQIAYRRVDSSLSRAIEE